MKTLALCVAAALLAACCFGSSTLANPIVPNVVAGGATFTHNGQTLSINTTDRAIINWQGFSIAAGETTRFVQPGANSAVLNRVVGGNPSAIFGQLQANGQVYLINPNGILIGPGASINVGGLVASTLDIDNAQFMRGGELRFSGPSGAAVVNRGLVKAIEGDIYLIGAQVENHGALVSTKGTVGLAAGQEVLLVDSAHQHLVVKPTAASVGTTGVTNTGLIDAVQAELAAHGNVYALAINNQGTIRATGSATIGGRVYLTAPGGKIETAGKIAAQKADRGGEVKIMADDIKLAGATIDVSGKSGGGVVLVGGEYQGQNADGTIKNAQFTSVDSTSTIRADAIENGDGGRVIVWSDQATRFDGAISIRGGAAGGDGGFAEVSGKQTLAFGGNVDARAPLGQTGHTLLDPVEVTLSGQSVAWFTANLTVVATNDIEIAPPFFTPQGGPTANDLSLRSTDGDIVVRAPLLNLGAGKIGLTAEKGSVVVMPGAAIGSGLGQVDVIAGTDINLMDTVSAFGPGGVHLAAGRDVLLSGDGTAITSAGPIGIMAGRDIRAGGNITSQSGAIMLDAGRDLFVNARVTSDSGTIGLFAKGNLIVEGTIDSSAVVGSRMGNVNVEADGDVVVRSGPSHGQIGWDGAGSVKSRIAVEAGGGVIVHADQPYATAQIGHGAIEQSGNYCGPITVNAGRDVRLLAEADGSLAQIGHGGMFVFGSAFGNVRVDAGRDVSLSSDGLFSIVQIGHFVGRVTPPPSDFGSGEYGGDYDYGDDSYPNLGSIGVAIGRIEVRAGRDISLSAHGEYAAQSQIGHTADVLIGRITGIAGHDLRLAAGKYSTAQIGHQSNDSCALFRCGDVVLASDQFDPLVDHGGRFYIDQNSRIDAGGGKHGNVLVFGTRRLGNVIEDGASINGVRFDGSLPPGTITAGPYRRWNENTEFVDWDHEMWGFTLADFLGGNPSLIVNRPFTFYFLDNEQPTRPAVPQFPHDQFERYALWAETLPSLWGFAPYSMSYEGASEEPWKSKTGSTSAETFGR